MRLGVRIDSIRRVMEEEVKAGREAVQSSIHAAGTGIKNAWRGQVAGAGLGQRLGRTIRSEVWPKHHASLNAAALVWSRAPVIVAAHASGAMIRAKSGMWLAIPTEAAGRIRGGKRPTPSEWEARTGMKLRFVAPRGRSPMLVAEGRLNTYGRAVRSRSRTGRGLTTVPIFILVRQVSLRKRLDLERPARAALAALPAQIERRWSKAK